MIRLVPAFAILFSLTACTTTLLVRKVMPTDPAPAAGWAYSLPYTQFDMTITRTFNGCPDGATVPTYSYGITPVATSQADPAHTYAVDYDSLSSALKTSDLKLTWGDNRVLTGINAAAVDKTGTVITYVATGLANLAVMVATGGVGAPPTATACRALITLETAAALKKRDQLEKAQKPVNAALDRATARLTGLTGTTSQLGQRVDSRVQALVIAAAEQVVREKQKVQDAANALAENEKLLTEIITLTLAADGTLDADGTQMILVSGGQKALAKWTGQQHTADSFRAVVQLRPTSTVRASAAEPTADGLRYRVPVKGGVWLCMLSRGDPALYSSDEQPTDDVPDCKTGKFKAALTASVPQLGPISVLTFHNGPFQDNAIAATFATDGSLTMAEYKVNNSSAETASSAFLQVTTSAETVAKNITGAGTTITNAELAQVKVKNDLLAAKAANTTAEQTGLIQANTSLVSAQTAYLNAQQALAKAQTPSP